jgi:long-subunit acyl-CoA synthetase (AMP-forming)
MTAHAFNFRLFTKACFAMGHQSGGVTVCIDASATPVGVNLRLNPTEARAMAVALEAAATYAENVIAETGLGESAVDAPAVAA